KSGDYRSAATGFSQALAARPNNDSVKFYEALSLVRLDQEDKAVPLLAAISTKTELSLKAKWYSALILIHQKKPGEAAVLLRDINTEGAVYAGEAAKLLIALKEK